MNDPRIPSSARGVLALWLCLAAVSAAAASDKKKEGMTMEWTGSFCPIEKPERLVVKTGAEWRALWQRIGKPAPPIDLKRYFAVAVFLGTEPTGGFTVSWETAPGLVRYAVKRPTGMAIEALTQPYAIKLFPRSAGDVKVEAAHD